MFKIRLLVPREPSGPDMIGWWRTPVHQKPGGVCCSFANPSRLMKLGRFPHRCSRPRWDVDPRTHRVRKKPFRLHIFEIFVMRLVWLPASHFQVQWA